MVDFSRPYSRKDKLTKKYWKWIQDLFYKGTSLRCKVLKLYDLWFTTMLFFIMLLFCIYNNIQVGNTKFVVFNFAIVKENSFARFICSNSHKRPVKMCKHSLLPPPHYPPRSLFIYSCKNGNCILAWKACINSHTTHV